MKFTIILDQAYPNIMIHIIIFQNLVSILIFCLIWTEFTKFILIGHKFRFLVKKFTKI